MAEDIQQIRAFLDRLSGRERRLLIARGFLQGAIALLLELEDILQNQKPRPKQRLPLKPKPRLLQNLKPRPLQNPRPKLKHPLKQKPPPRKKGSV